MPAELVRFNAMIPPSMLSAPLPIEIWPSTCKDPYPENAPALQPNSSESPVLRLVAALGLVPAKS